MSFGQMCRIGTIMCGNAKLVPFNGITVIDTLDSDACLVSSIDGFF